MRRAIMCSALVAVYVLIAASTGLALHEPQEKTIWLYLQPTETAEGSTISSIMLFELRSELERQGFPLVADQADADLAIVGSIRIEDTLIILEVRGWEVPTGNPILDIELKAASDIGIYNQLASLAGVMAEDLLSWLQSPETYVMTPHLGAIERTGAGEGPPPPKPAVEPRLPQEPTAVRVTLFSNDEGAEIYVGQGELAGTIVGGKLTIETRAGGLLNVEKRKAGYHADREDFPISDQPVEISLRPLRRITRFALELSYTSSQFLGFGAGFRWYLIPDYLLLRADEYSYFSLGLAFHQDFRLSLGSYLFTPPHWRVRVGMATGLGIILSILDGSTHRDWYWEVADLWLDLNWNRWAVFLRAELKYALGLDDGLLDRGLLTEYGPQFTVGWLWKW